MILHIMGPSGSGKTTLGNKIRKKLKNVIVIDTDDIDDPNALKLLKKYSFNSNDKKIFNQEDKQFKKERMVKNKQSLKRILKNKSNKHIVFVGFLHPGLHYLEKNVNKRYAIKIDAEQLWRQYNYRTSEIIHKNITEIKKMLTNKRISPTKIHMIMSYKLGIRNGFDCESSNDMKKWLKKGEKDMIKKKYFYNSADKIFKDVCKVLST